MCKLCAISVKTDTLTKKLLCTFRAEIFISANNPDQNPDIYVGEYDSLAPGEYQMRGELGVDYEAVKVINGKGIFAKRTKSEGIKNWGGLIAMKTETGTKIYPFEGEYLVAAKTAVVSPVNMNVLYLITRDMDILLKNLLIVLSFSNL